MNREARRDWMVFGLLLAFGVVGRWLQPAWNFTPLAAVAAMGGYCFRSWLPAILLPASVLAISDLLLPTHDSLAVQASVHLTMLAPLALGRTARLRDGWRRAACWGLCGFVPATLFFLATNFAVWSSRSAYAPTLAGLVECYVRGLPFYRTMLAGDVCYVSLMAACLAAAQLGRRDLAPANATRRTPK